LPPAELNRAAFSPGQLVSAAGNRSPRPPAMARPAAPREPAGMPAPVASFNSDVAGIMLLKPLLEPLDSLRHGLEVAGHLIHDKLGGFSRNAADLRVTLSGRVSVSVPARNAPNAAYRLKAVHSRDARSDSSHPRGAVGSIWRAPVG
jgi:hypothetical protein